MIMTTFLLNSLGRDRPRSDPLFIKIYAMDSCRVDSVRLLVSLQYASLFFPALFFLTASHPLCVIQR